MHVVEGETGGLSILETSPNTKVSFFDAALPGTLPVRREEERESKRGESLREEREEEKKEDGERRRQERREREAGVGQARAQINIQTLYLLFTFEYRY